MYMEEVKFFPKFFYHYQHFGQEYAEEERLGPIC